MAGAPPPGLTISRDGPHPGYRPCVGLMLINAAGLLFIGQRRGPVLDAWQMPQGGIDPDETPRDAAWRELREEVGTDRAQLLAESRCWYAYDLPRELGRRAGAVGIAGRARSGSRSASPARTRTSTSPRTSRNSCAGAGRGPTRSCAWSSSSSVRSTKRSSTSSAICWPPERRRGSRNPCCRPPASRPAREKTSLFQRGRRSLSGNAARLAGGRASARARRRRTGGIDARPPQA